MSNEVTVLAENRLTPNLEARSRILALQEVIASAVVDPEEVHRLCPLKHVFAPGGTCKHLYAREIFIPAGMVIVGKIHKHAHLNMLMKGRVTVVTETGREEYTAPMTMVSQAGTKRALYAIEDVVWVTIHLVNDMDLDKIEDEVIAKSFEELAQFYALEEEKP